MNIFEGAKFGDRFKTRDGRMVLYIEHTTFYKGWYWTSVQDQGTCRYFEDGHILISGEESPLDIIGKWEEPIDEEELDRLAEEYASNSENVLEYSDGWEEHSDNDYVIKAFKNGYRKAKGE